MTQTIEQLQARVAELEAENARLKAMEESALRVCSHLDDIVMVMPYDYLDPPDGGNTPIHEQIKRMYSEVKVLRNNVANADELQARVAELEAEVERLIGCLLHLHRMSATEACIEIPSVGDYVEQMEKQLISAQAEIKRMRDALQTYIDEHEECQDADDWMAMMCSMEAHHVADEALAQPSDTSALDAYVAEKVKEETDEYAALIDRLSKLLAETAIALKGEEAALTRHSWHDLPVVALSKMVEISELTRQRDLAVEALKWLKLIFTDETLSQERDPELWMPTVDEAIKESEVK